MLASSSAPSQSQLGQWRLHLFRRNFLQKATGRTAAERMDMTVLPENCCILLLHLGDLQTRSRGSIEIAAAGLRTFQWVEDRNHLVVFALGVILKLVVMASSARQRNPEKSL